MGKDSFKLPPVSPLLGTTLRNYYRITKGQRIDPGFRMKYILTLLIILVLTPFRWYEHLRFATALKRTQVKNPVFILGHWRSGTTFLHSLLCKDPAAGYVNTYQTVFPNFMASQRVFGPFMKNFMPEKRPSDNVKLAMEYPQEEEFGLTNTNPHSYYNFFYFPEAYSSFYEQGIHFKGLTGTERQRFAQDYRKLLQKALITGSGNHLVIKNPVNTARVTFLAREYPDARFILLQRNPYSVYLSSKKFFLNLIPTLWFRPVQASDITDMILEVYKSLYDDYLNQSEVLHNIHEVKFEAIEADPIASLRKIYKDLEIDGFETALPHFEAYVDSQKFYRKNTYEITQEEINRIQQKWGMFIEKWEYEIPDNIKVA